MRVQFANPALDTVWLSLVALAFVVIVPLWLILSVERYGARVVIVAVALALCYRLGRD